MRYRFRVHVGTTAVREPGMSEKFFDAVRAELGPDSLDTSDDRRTGVLVEYGDTDVMFTRPADRRTSDYVTGRFG